MGPDEPAGRLYPVQGWHPDVYEHDVRLQPGRTSFSVPPRLTRIARPECRAASFAFPRSVLTAIQPLVSAPASPPTAGLAKISLASTRATMTRATALVRPTPAGTWGRFARCWSLLVQSVDRPSAARGPGSHADGLEGLVEWLDD
jgi:hypothetical protein